MSKQQISLVSILSAALLMAAGAAQAASAKEGVVTLPRVVITGKAVKDTVQIARVVQLPRVVVTGYSVEGQLRRQMLAQAKTDAKPVRPI